MDLGLQGSGALVTGGHRGIGLSVARALIDEGARVAILGRDTDALTRAATSLGHDTVVVVADTTDDAAVRRAVEEAATALGRLDVVVNCAAPRAVPGRPPGLAGLDDDDLLHQVDTKVLGYARVVRAAEPHLVRAGGRVVNVSGMNARATGSVTGSVRNIGVVALTKNLADDLGPRGVAVTCVHPGLTVTERTEDDADFLAAAAGNSLARPVTAGEIADTVAFLASPRARLLNGAVLEADGGRPGPIWA